jgi:hypothetical protein
MLAGRESSHEPPTDEQHQQRSTTNTETALSTNSQSRSVTRQSQGNTQLNSGTSVSHVASRAETKGSGRRSAEDQEEEGTEEGEEEEESDDGDEDSSEEEERDQVPDLSQKMQPRPGGRGEGGVNMLVKVGLCDLLPWWCSRFTHEQTCSAVMPAHAGPGVTTQIYTLIVLSLKC